MHHTHYPVELLAKAGHSVAGNIANVYMLVVVVLKETATAVAA